MQSQWVQDGVSVGLPPPGRLLCLSVCRRLIFVGNLSKKCVNYATWSFQVRFTLDAWLPSFGEQAPPPTMQVAGTWWDWKEHQAGLWLV